MHQRREIRIRPLRGSASFHEPLVVVSRSTRPGRILQVEMNLRQDGLPQSWAMAPCGLVRCRHGRMLPIGAPLRQLLANRKDRQLPPVRRHPSSPLRSTRMHRPQLTIGARRRPRARLQPPPPIHLHPAHLQHPVHLQHRVQPAQEVHRWSLIARSMPSWPAKPRQIWASVLVVESSQCQCKCQCAGLGGTAGRAGGLKTGLLLGWLAGWPHGQPQLGRAGEVGAAAHLRTRLTMRCWR